MSEIRDDFAKVLAARTDLVCATSLPKRFYNSCAYSDECRGFVEKHLHTIKWLLEQSDRLKDRAA